MNYSYSDFMSGENPYLIMNIDTKNPIELSEFVGGFTSLSRQYERFLKVERPDLSKEAQIYVREVRAGSIEVDLLPWLMGAGGTAIGTGVWVLDKMDKIQILEKFINDYKVKFNRFKSGNFDKDVPASELKDWSDAVTAIATDENGNKTLSLATYEDGKKQIRAAFQFNTQDARKVRKVIDAKLIDMGQKTHPSQERVLMVYTRADINEAATNKKSGERVIINSIAKKHIPIMYSSELAEAQIKHELRTSEYPFKLGFVVDVFVETNAAGKAIAYAVTDFHSTIDLSDDED